MNSFAAIVNKTRESSLNIEVASDATGKTFSSPSSRPSMANMQTPESRHRKRRRDNASESAQESATTTKSGLSLLTKEQFDVEYNLLQDSCNEVLEEKEIVIKNLTKQIQQQIQQKDSEMGFSKDQKKQQQNNIYNKFE